jgi:hypothetical protein
MEATLVVHVVERSMYTAFRKTKGASETDQVHVLKEKGYASRNKGPYFRGIRDTNGTLIGNRTSDQVLQYPTSQHRIQADRQALPVLQ